MRRMGLESKKDITRDRGRACEVKRRAGVSIGGGRVVYDSGPPGAGESSVGVVGRIGCAKGGAVLQMTTVDQGIGRVATAWVR